MRERLGLGVLALASSFVLIPSRVMAQEATCQVALSELTVNDEPPPERFRDLLANGIRPTIDPILACYRERVSQRPGLAGNLRMRLWVSARQVIRATPEESTLGDPALEQCAIARIREFTLPPEAPEGGARVRFVLRFWLNGTAAPTPPTEGPQASSGTQQAPPSGQAPLMTLLPPAGTPSAPEPPRATLSVESARGAIEAAALGYLIDPAGLAACPPAVGTVRATLTIRASGQVSARAARGGTIRDRNVTQCVLGALQARPIPQAPGDTRATVVITYSR